MTQSVRGYKIRLSPLVIDLNIFRISLHLCNNKLVNADIGRVFSRKATSIRISIPIPRDLCRALS